MNHTNYVILKLLFQQPLTENELLKYLNINIITLRKAISQLNIKLSDLHLPIIENKNFNYTISLSKKEKDFFYKSCQDYSQNQRINYLSLKLLINKTLNLDQELKSLNISRATITRDVSTIKSKLQDKNIYLISKKWEGIFYEVYNENSLYEYLCELLIVIYSEYNSLPGVLKSYLKSLQEKKIEKTLGELFKIYDLFHIQIGNISIRYFLALRICFNTFENFHLKTILCYIDKIKTNKNFKDICIKLTTVKDIEEKYIPYIAMNIYDVIHQKFYLENIFNQKVIFYCSYFNLSLQKGERYLLNFFLYLSNFRYKNELYEVKNIYLKSNFDDLILKKLKIFLKKMNINMFYGDLLELLDFTKYFFIKNAKATYKKILILKKDVNLSYYPDLEKTLKQTYPNFHFEIRPYAYVYIMTDSVVEYDLILSDTVLNLEFNYKLCQVNNSLINAIDNYLIGDFISNKKDFHINKLLVK